jgi:hypothetical protein
MDGGGINSVTNIGAGEWRYFGYQDVGGAYVFDPCVIDMTVGVLSTDYIVFEGGVAFSAAGDVVFQATVGDGAYSAGTHGDLGSFDTVADNSGNISWLTGAVPPPPPTAVPLFYEHLLGSTSTQIIF